MKLQFIAELTDVVFMVQISTQLSPMHNKRLMLEPDTSAPELDKEWFFIDFLPIRKNLFVELLD